MTERDQVLERKRNLMRQRRAAARAAGHRLLTVALPGQLVQQLEQIKRDRQLNSFDTVLEQILSAALAPVRQEAAD